MRLSLAIFALLVWSAASGQEFLALGGVTHARSVNEDTYGWGVEYAHGLGEHFYTTLAWLNEGHVPGHHRDGHAAQLWGRVDLLDRRLTLALGAGAYRYFDTVPDPQGGSIDDHGWGLITDAAATWYTNSRWFVQLRAERVDAKARLDTTAYLVGIGYQLDAPASRGPVTYSSAHPDLNIRNELAAFLGRSVINNFGSAGEQAWSVEYRRNLWPFLEWSVSWIHESEIRAPRRDGLASQLWLARTFLGERFGLGVGLGPYFAIERNPEAAAAAGNPGRVAGMLTLTATYRFMPHWFARIFWDRVETNYNRDSDIFLLGGGFRF